MMVAGCRIWVAYIHIGITARLRVSMNLAKSWVNPLIRYMAMANGVVQMPSYGPREVRGDLTTIRKCAI